MIRYFLKLCFLFLVTYQLPAQITYPDDYFIPPLDIPMKLTGTFGELRSDHFHAGIDLKTGEIEGLNIYAIADGYVSRIKIQEGGYGKALYITHPNGYVSVYAHLSKYNDEIGSYVLDKQYKNESYTLDIYPEEDEISVEQGEIIAYSGNSGRSGGPHLHFEIRDEASQMPINPLLFGYRVTDNDAPVINVLKIYPYGPGSHVNGSALPVEFFPTANNAIYTLPTKDTIQVGGSFYPGVNTIDLFNGGVNRNGVYRIRVWMDSVPVYEHTMNTFSFYETRYINSLLDYSEFIEKRRQVQKTFVQPNNQLSVYQTIQNRGILTTKPNKTHDIIYEISDIAGNISVLSFLVKGTQPHDADNMTEPTGVLFNYDTENVFQTEEVSLKVPDGSLYDTIYFKYYQKPGPAGSYSKLHCFHNELTPLHKWSSISIRCEGLPVDETGKALIARLDNKGKLSSAGGYYKDGYIQTQIRKFGNYYVVTDTVKPVIIPLNIKVQKSILAQTTIRVKILDELSGIKSYRGTLNNQWILMEYDEKNDLLTYYFDKHLKDGENLFELTVTDKKENRKIYRARLIY